MPRLENPAGASGDGNLTGSPLDVIRLRTESVGGLVVVGLAVLVVVLLGGGNS